MEIEYNSKIIDVNWFDFINYYQDGERISECITIITQVKQLEKLLENYEAEKEYITEKDYNRMSDYIGKSFIANTKECKLISVSQKGLFGNCLMFKFRFK